MSEGSTVKDRLLELINNVNSCVTVSGVTELEKLYNKKKETIGDRITPMMDIMVRDAITGRKKEIQDAEEGEAEMKTSKKSAEEESKAVAKMDEVLVLKASTLTESSDSDIGTFVFGIHPSTIDLGIVSNYFESLADIADTVDGLPVSIITSGPLKESTYQMWCESIDAQVECVKSDQHPITSIVESIPKDAKSIYIAANNQQDIAIAKTAAKLIQRAGMAESVIVIDISNPMITESYYTIEDMVKEGNIEAIAEETNQDAANAIYEDIEVSL